MERTNPERSGGPDGGASPFGSFWGDCQKEPAQQGGTEASSNARISNGTKPKPLSPTRAALPLSRKRERGVTVPRSNSKPALSKKR